MSSHGVPHGADHKENKSIGIFVSVLAVLMAIVTALASREANSMIVKEVKASNGFSWYQSKRQRSYLNEVEIARIDRDLLGTPNEAQRKALEDSKSKLKAKNAEYEKENQKILTDSELDRTEAQLASHRHHRYEYAEVLLHVAVVLCSLTLLTDSKLYFKLGIAATLAGLLFAVSAFLMSGHENSSESNTNHPAAPAASHP